MSELKSAIDPILLLPKQHLHELLLLIGAVQFKQEISHILLSKELEVLKNAIGEKLYEFVINRGHFYTLPTIKPIQESLTKNPELVLLSAGTLTLSKIVQSDNHQILQRFLLKLPPEIDCKNLKFTANPTHLQDRTTLIKIARDSHARCLRYLN